MRDNFENWSHSHETRYSEFLVVAEYESETWFLNSRWLIRQGISFFLINPFHLELLCKFSRWIRIQHWMSPLYTGSDICLVRVKVNPQTKKRRNYKQIYNIDINVNA